MKLKSLFLASSLALFPAGAPAAINFSGGAADITFFYESQTGPSGTWHTVLREKGTTVATGLDNSFAGFTGIVDAGDDWTFTTLTTSISTTTSVLVGATNYFVAAASGSPFLASGIADLGIRTRLRENEVALGIGTNTAANQFDSFNLTLNLGASTFNGDPLAGNAAVSLLHWNTFDEPLPLIDSANSLLTANFTNWGHIHRNWGFSEYGNYELVFTLQGVGGTYGATASTGSTTLSFEVVPEPATYALFTGLLALGLICYRRRIKA